MRELPSLRKQYQSPVLVQNVQNYFLSGTSTVLACCVAGHRTAAATSVLSCRPAFSRTLDQLPYSCPAPLSLALDRLLPTSPHALSSFVLLPAPFFIRPERRGHLDSALLGRLCAVARDRHAAPVRIQMPTPAFACACPLTRSRRLPTSRRRPMCLVFDNHWSRGPNPKDVNDEGFFSHPEQVSICFRPPTLSCRPVSRFELPLSPQCFAL